MRSSIMLVPPLLALRRGAIENDVKGCTLGVRESIRMWKCCIASAAACNAVTTP